MNALVVMGIVAFLFIVFSWLPRVKKFTATIRDREQSDITVIISATANDTCELSVRRALEQAGVASVLLIIEGAFQKINDSRLNIIHTTQAPPGWTQKRWGQQQALTQVATEYVLLLDGDVELMPFTATSMRARLHKKSLHYLSLVPAPRLVTRLERNLLPLLMYLTRLRYPWIMPRRSSLFAYASTNCLLIQLSALEKIAGFARISNTADDSAWGKVLNASKLKGRLRYSHAARRHTPVSQLSDLVHYGAQARAGSLLLLVFALLSPVIAWFFTEPPYFLVIFCVWLGILGSYLPTLRYYNLHPVKLLLLPGAIFVLGWACLRLYMNQDQGNPAKWHQELIETGVET